MKEIRIAIIGTGMISHRHMTVINNLKKQGQALTVVAAAEIDKDKLEAFGKQYGIPEENLYQVTASLERAVEEFLNKYGEMSGRELAEQRYHRFRQIGTTEKE